MEAEKPHILIVDDEPLNLELLSRILESKYRITIAYDAEEALMILHGEGGDKIKLVLSDHVMPGLTGAELSKAVFQTWPSIPFVLITGMESQEVDAAKEKGWVRRVLYKPWRKSNLETVVEEYVG